MKKRLAATCLLACLLASPATWALDFGQNKVRPGNFNWRILSTDHFDVYYYPEEEQLARRACVVAEQAYVHDTRVMDYFPKARTPLFIFQNHLDFEQTNITQEILSGGVGGFTEAFKNRVVLPTTGSDRWLRTVVFHEFTHALQFDTLYGETARSFHVLKNYLIPLWMTEGQAEYCAQNWDSSADMVLRDGVLNDRVKPLELMDGFQHLEEVYLAYKAGQSAVQYLSDRYGADKVALLMKRFKAELATDDVIREVTGIPLRQFSKEWMAALRQKYWVQANGKQSAGKYGRPLTHDTSEFLNSNNGAAWSPDGQKIAYVSERNAKEQIWVMDSAGRESKVLFGGPFEGIGREGTLAVPGNRLSWSPDGGTLAFVEDLQEKAWLDLGSVAGGSIRRLDLPFDDLAGPAFSPDGKRIAFAGSRHGEIRIWSVDRQGRDLRAVTGEETKASLLSDPAWSPDGAWLAFSGEVEGRPQIFLVHPDGSGERMISDPGCSNVMPAFVPDGKRILYASDAGGIYNLVESDLEGKQRKPLSDVVYGLFAPKPSPDGSSVLYVAYEDGCENLYLMNSPTYEKTAASRSIQALRNPYLAVSHAAKPAPPAPPGGVSAQVGLPDLAEGEAADGGLNTATASLLPSRPYKFDFSPDLFFLLLGFDSLDGLVGEGYLTASDMLGESNVTLYANFVPGYQSQAQLQYLLAHGRWDTTLSVFYSRTTFPYFYNLVPQQNLPTYFDQETGAGLTFVYPFSLFNRFEFGISSSYIYRDVSDLTLLPPEALSTLGTNLVNTFSASLVHDTTHYYLFEPINGTRANLNFSVADHWMGSSKNFVFEQAEAQAYLPLEFVSRDTVLSLRLLGLEQNGTDRELFYFGGNLVRGMDYGERLAEKFAVANLEIRRPFLEEINYALWPLDFLLIKDVHLRLFYDSGVSGFDWSDIRTTADIQGGYGLGILMHTFILERALVTWRFDIATRVRWNENPSSMDNTHYYFTLGTMF